MEARPNDAKTAFQASALSLAPDTSHVSRNCKSFRPALHAMTTSAYWPLESRSVRGQAGGLNRLTPSQSRSSAMFGGGPDEKLATKSHRGEDIDDEQLMRLAMISNVANRRLRTKESSGRQVR